MPCIVTEALTFAAQLSMVIFLLSNYLCVSSEQALIAKMVHRKNPINRFSVFKKTAILPCVEELALRPGIKLVNVDTSSRMEVVVQRRAIAMA